MASSTSLQLITTSEQRTLAERLWQLYWHDLSEFRGYMPGSSGLYETTRLLNYFEDPNRCGYLIYSDQALEGFALIHGLAGETRVMGDFFVVRAARRQHVGHDSAVKGWACIRGDGRSHFRRKTQARPASGDASVQSWPPPDAKKSNDPSRGNRRYRLTYGCFSALRSD